MAENLTVKQAQQQVTAFLKAKGKRWTHLNNHYYRVTHLVEEMGELARAVINFETRLHEPKRRGLSRPRPERLASVRDSLGDILYHLLVLAAAYNLDLQSAFQDSMRSIKKRYTNQSHS